jgi:hypothetical protein
MLRNWNPFANQVFSLYQRDENENSKCVIGEAPDKINIFFQRYSTIYQVQ